MSEEIKNNNQENEKIQKKPGFFRKTASDIRRNAGESWASAKEHPGRLLGTGLAIGGFIGAVGGGALGAAKAFRAQNVEAEKPEEEFGLPDDFSFPEGEEVSEEE